MRGPGTDKKRLSLALLCVGAAGMGILAWPHREGKPTTLPVSAAAWKVAPQESEAQTPAASAPLPTVGIGIDATQKEPADPEALRSLVREVGGAQGSGETADPSSAAPDWFTWGRLAEDRAKVHADPSDSLDLYGITDPEGATLCLVNRASQKLPTVVRFRLPRGVYKIERLIFSPQPSPTSGSEPNPAADAADTKSTARLDRLEGRDLAATGVVVKAYTLEPGQVCLYRCENEAREARLALAEIQDRLHALAASSPGPARRLRRILSEGSAYWSGLYAPRQRRRDLSRRLGCIHRLLLLVAQAQSLHHNYQRRGTVNADRGAEVMGALERLSDALAQTSATLLGLVPQITVDETPLQAGAQSGVKAAVQQASVPPPAEASRSALVTVSLADTGGSDVGLVKIGLDTTALPPGVSCEPPDPAIFGTLRPGQTVRATFRLHYASPPALVRNRCVGDISYFAAGAAAHLRPRPW